MVATLIKGAHIIDPATSRDGIYDILINNGIIQNIGVDIKTPQEYITYNANGLIACAGLIDLHVHVYEHSTMLGVNVDQTCLLKGVTTVIDAGSAGAATFPGLKHYVINQSKTRVLAFLHIANHGLASAGCATLVKGGECDSLNQLDVEQCINCINKYPEDIVGIKIRLSESVANNGINEIEAYKRALEVSKHTGKPLMTHHAFSSIPTDSSSSDLACPGSLQKGDIYTHLHHSYINNNETVNFAFTKARQRGVIMDVGHGMGSFNWKNAETCARYKFWPDTISTDLHSDSLNGPAYNLTTVMSKFLHLGMSIDKVIEAATTTPAKVVKLDHRIGSLQAGREADITLIRIAHVNTDMEDRDKELRRMEKQIIAVVVWRKGVKYDCV